MPHRILLIYGVILILAFNSYTDGHITRPNIVLIIADDMGWNDVSYHGSDQIMTPNIDLLAYSGVALERYYTHCVCTPSRSALYTGKFSHVLGMQGYPLTTGEDRALPLTEKILPQYLKDLGYATHLVGKWHVGHARTEYLPTFRGFDTHFGHRTGYIDYYEYTAEETWVTGDVAGLDLYRNLTADWESTKYVTDLYNEEAISSVKGGIKAIATSQPFDEQDLSTTIYNNEIVQKNVYKKNTEHLNKINTLEWIGVIKDHNKAVPLFLTVAHNAPHSANSAAPLQAPPEEVRKMRHVESPERRVYAAMVKKLDDSVGDIFKALYDKGILDNTIVVFVSDNGGMTSGRYMNYASNWPLRGLKMSPFEGGIRVNGLIWSKNISDSDYHSWSGYMHVVDWVPTLLSAAGGNPPSNIDGINLWTSITKNNESKRDIVFEINDYSGFATIIAGDYKLVTGNVGPNYGTHHGQSLSGIIGSAPSYTNAIQKSAVYSVLNNIGHNSDSVKPDVRKQSVNCSGIPKKLCFPDKEHGKMCLFNIKEDPCETRDLSSTYPNIVKDLNTRLQKEMLRVIPRKIPFYSDPRAAPALHNFTWAPWMDNFR